MTMQDDYFHIDTTPENPEYDAFAAKLAAEDTAESELEERRAAAKAAKAAKDDDDVGAGIPLSQLGLDDDDEADDEDTLDDELDDAEAEDEDGFTVTGEEDEVEVEDDDDIALPFGETAERVEKDRETRETGYKRAVRNVAKSMRRMERRDTKALDDLDPLGLDLRIAGIRPSGFNDDLPATRKHEAKAASHQKGVVDRLRRRMRKGGFFGKDGQHEEFD